MTTTAKVRVAPRNIQFLDHIEIREIPTDNFEVEDQPIDVKWDPNLRNKKVFKVDSRQQRNIIIGCVVVGISLIAIIIVIVVAVVLTQRTQTTSNESLTYNQVCTVGSNQCKSSLGLYCPNGFCSCKSPFSWNTVTNTCTLLTYGGSCSMSSQCNSSLGLSCANQRCQCDSYHSWNSANNTCIVILNNTLTYGATCAVGSPQCNSSVELTCTSNCTCMNSKVWNVSSCVCPAGTFLNSSNLCQTAYTYNHSCVISSNQCDSTKGLSCYNNSLCQCDSTTYWNLNFGICMPRANYSQACSADSDCVPTLICPSVAGVCNCSQYLPDFVCNCPNTMYYNSTIRQCVNRATFNGSCLASANYTCQLSLYCNAGNCACPAGTNWIVANSTCS